ncbi:prepilin peptidase [Vagococcus sp. DIV0080]|uniref:Prepilin peptidase n=1 Tax=Candidatus Vagococcus giribetii TaxID=2230876 RepID=A0ABS3HRE4_9ENTE|nr:A24 family peptidase [Vagococcus sp. DIV0080]MBO0475880.1 prepilin peptidase [Vagococcus sp. DIV0080]
MSISTADYMLVYGLLFILGSCLGSFFILVGSRTAKKQSIVTPASHCSSCQTPLKIYELIPVFSWLFLRGKCRTCQTKIPVSYILLEALSGLVMMTSCYLLAWSTETIVAMTFYYLLLTITISDIEEHKIPNAVLLPFFIIGLFERLLISPTSNWFFNPLLGVIFGFGVMFLLAYFSKGGMGGGDIKLLAVIGVFVGPIGALITLFLAAFMGLFYAIFSGAAMKKGTKIPFGPFLAIGAWLVYFYFSNQLATLLTLF